MARPLLPLALVTAVLVSCGGEAEPGGAVQGDDGSEAPAPTATISASVTIAEPADGSEVSGPAVTVRLNASGVRIVEAGDTTDGTGHHHLYLDEDLTPPDQPVPTVPGRIVHMGDGSADYVFEDVAPGEHRLIAVVADGVHVPLQPWVVDTVTFTVRQP